MNLIPYTRNRMLISLLGSLLLISGGLSTAHAAPKQKVTVQLSWKYQYQFAPFIAALEKGFYREAGLEVQLLEGGPSINAVDKVVDGDADYGVFSSALVVEYARGKPVMALAALIQHSPVGLMVRRDLGIESVHDLAGREIAVSPDTRDEIRAYLQASGLSDRQIRLVDKTKLGLKSLETHVAMSIYISNEGFHAHRNAAKYALLYPRSAGVDLFGNILFSTREITHKRADEVSRFRAATLRGLSYALDHQEEITSIILQRYNTQHKSREHLLYEAQIISELTHPDIVEPGYMSPVRWEHVKEVYASQGQLQADLDLQEFLYDPNPQEDVTWLYGILVSITIVLLITATFLWQTRRFNRRLQESENKFRDLFEKNPDPCWLIENNTFVECNEEAAHTLGYASPEALRYRHPSMVSPQYQPDGRPSKEKANEMMALAYEKGVHRFEWEHMRRNGETFPAEVTLARVQQSGRDMLFCVWRDITQRKESDRIKEEFVSTVSHELRTPLTAIRGTLKFLSSGRLEGKEEQSREMLRIAESNSDKLLFLINDLLDIEKLESGDIQLQMNRFGLNEFLRECVEENQSFAQQYHTHIVLGECADMELIADQQRLKQVVSNLLSNACKYSPQGAPVEVTAEMVGDRLRIDVRDHGPGIPADFKAKLFDKFTQADSSSTRKLGGTGLGLAIVKRIVELHGGEVQYTTAESAGTTFHVYLPATDFPV